MLPARLAVVGPTATGKSDLAVALARRLGDIEIVSADSMCVYRGMDIGTATPGPTDRHDVPHHLIDVADPDEEWTVVRHQRLVDEAVADIEGRGRRPLLVGGTGLYVHAVVDHLAIPGRHPEVRQRLESEPTETLRERLERLDPVAAARIAAGNRRRLLRALEVTEGSGQPFSSFGPGVTGFGPTRWSIVGLTVARPLLDVRIEARYDAQLAAGLLDEVRRLDGRALSPTAAQALGYRELLAHVRGELALAEAIEEAVRRTKRFARRQERWFRRDPRIRWFAHDGNSLAALDAVLRHWCE